MLTSLYRIFFGRLHCSGTRYIHTLMVHTFSTFLTLLSLPVLFMGIFGQEVDDKISLAVPHLFMRGIERREWSEVKFWCVIDTIVCYLHRY